MVGLEPCSQKRFESRLFARLSSGLGACLVLEGESRRIGDVTLPARVWDALSGGTNLELRAPLERRVAVLREEYLASPRARAELARQLPLVEARMRRERGAPPLVELLERDAIEPLVRELLEGHYDPLYRHGELGRRYAARFESSEPARAAEQIVHWIEQRLADGR
jgi:tRNA 2-selenouridine synthase